MVTQRTLKYQGFLKIEELTVKNPSGKFRPLEVAYKNKAVAALVYNTLTHKYIFARQWRPASESNMLEVPAGVRDKPGESAEECIAREIMEEIGYKTDRLKFITEGYVSPGWTTEMISIYYAEVSQKTEKGGGLETENEEIEIVELTRAEMLATTFNDFKSFIAVQWAKYNQPNL